jgi:hypothetical protein
MRSHIFKIYVHFILSFKITCLMLEVGRYDQNMYHALARLIQFVVVEGSKSQF